MYIRRKKHRSGTTSIVVVDKSGGKYREIKSFGIGRTDDESLCMSPKASDWIATCDGQAVIDFDDPNPNLNNS